MSAGRQVPTPASSRARPQTRLPWWALALPIAAFVALFCLPASPASADSGPGAGGGSMARVVQLVRHSAERLAP
ncbi:hypothetical protein AB0F13_18250 [Streptomyces sp. NPDC026206]|uniref:hypothetical protein n=1 Tax=Streptomyces sp. NPDC026206 TaxID=3157089 RepID=UPI0033FF70C2